MAARAYPKYPCVCNAVLFKGRLPCIADAHMHDGWTSLIRRKLEIRAIPAEHLEVFSEPFLQVLAAELTNCIQQRCATLFHASARARASQRLRRTLQKVSGGARVRPAQSRLP